MKRKIKNNSIVICCRLLYLFGAAFLMGAGIYGSLYLFVMFLHIVLPGNQTLVNVEAMLSHAAVSVVLSLSLVCLCFQSARLFVMPLMMVKKERRMQKNNHHHKLKKFGYLLSGSFCCAYGTWLFINSVFLSVQALQLHRSGALILTLFIITLAFFALVIGIKEFRSFFSSEIKPQKKNSNKPIKPEMVKREGQQPTQNVTVPSGRKNETGSGADDEQ